MIHSGQGFPFQGRRQGRYLVVGLASGSSASLFQAARDVERPKFSLTRGLGVVYSLDGSVDFV